MSTMTLRPAIEERRSVLISVVCCTHNREAFAVQHLRSLHPHLSEDIELIYALDNCTDNSNASLAAQAAGHPRVRVLEHKGERGLFNCRNFGLAHANGRFIHFLDDDDGVEAGFYGHLCRALIAEVNHDTDIYLSRLRITMPEGPQGEREVVAADVAQTGAVHGTELHLRGDFLKPLLYGALYFNGANALYSRALLQRYGYRQELKKSADWLFILEAALRQRLHIVYSPEIAANYFVHAASMSLGPDKAGWNARVFDILLKLAAGHPKHEVAIRARCAQANFDAGYSMRATAKRRAIRHYWRAWQLAPGIKPIAAIAKLALN